MSIRLILPLLLISLFGCLEKKEESVSKKKTTNTNNNGGGNTITIPTYNNSISWIRQFGSVTPTLGGDTSDDDFCLGLDVDLNGNVYCTGYTKSELGEGNASAKINSYIMKLDSDGNLVWIRQLGDDTTLPTGETGVVSICYRVKVDSEGNSFCAGETFGNLGEVNAGGSGGDAFVMKLDSNGNISWITQLGNNTKVSGVANVNQGNDKCNDIALDNSGNVYCAGETTGNMGEVNGGSSDAFILKLNNLGALVWVRQLGSSSAPGNSTKSDFCNGVDVDSLGNVYCSGYTWENLGEDNSNHPNMNKDLFIVKLFSNGEVDWIKQFGKYTKVEGLESANLGIDICYDIVVDNNQNIYCAGETTGNLGEVNGGDADAFVLKLNGQGELVWLTQLGASTKINDVTNANQSFDYCLGLSLDSNGNVYCTGFTHGNIGDDLAGVWDAFVLKLNSAGELLWVKQFGNSADLSGGESAEKDVCYDVAVDTNGKVFLGCYTISSFGEGNGSGTVTPKADILILKLE